MCIDCAMMINMLAKGRMVIFLNLRNNYLKRNK